MKDVGKLLFVLAIAILATAVGYRMGYNGRIVVKDLQVDTVTVTDTVTVKVPVPVKVEKIKEVVRVLRVDTVVHDSVRVLVPITQKTYTDSLTYLCKISGYEPTLDLMQVYPKTTYLTTFVKTKPRVVVSVGAFGGFGKNGLDYGLGLTIGIPVCSW